MPTWWRRKNPEHARHWAHEYYLKNRDAKIEYQHKHYQENKDKILPLCRKYHIKHRLEAKERSKHVIRFHDKRVKISIKPRTGKCSNCHRTVNSGEIKVTNMDHLWYDDGDPSAGIVERCVRCHNARHKFLRRMMRLVIPDLNEYVMLH